MHPEPRYVRLACTRALYCMDVCVVTEIVAALKMLKRKGRSSIWLRRWQRSALEGYGIHGGRSERRGARCGAVGH
eukprot:2953454-Pyramimonas_sp.AAC.2